MKVLIVEKDRQINQSLSFFIENQMKCKVLTADSKKEGEFLFNSSSFDVVICGEPLPDGEALEVLKGWMNQNPKLISILMTVKSDEHLRQEALRAGISGYLVKPFNLKQLEEIIRLPR
jgi:DNA-binding response OmpR family regulator